MCLMEKKEYIEPACMQTMIYMEHVICGSNYEVKIEQEDDDILWGE